jgi:hypothetical protein
MDPNELEIDIQPSSEKYIKDFNMIKENVSPPHYARWKVEPISFIMRNQIPYAEGNVIKYVMRHDMKDGVKDIDKAIRYLEMIKEEHYNAKG